VPAVVATDRAIVDEVAVQCATRCYAALAAGAGIRRAFEEARPAGRSEAAGSLSRAIQGDGSERPAAEPAVAVGAAARYAGPAGGALAPTRDIVHVRADAVRDDEGWPWALYHADGGAGAEEWSLAQAAGRW
jgi:hypothetical protein